MRRRLTWDDKVISLERTVVDLSPEERARVGQTIRTVLIMGRDLPDEVGQQLSDLLWDTIPRLGTAFLKVGGPAKKLEEMIERVAPQVPTLARLIKGEE